MLWSLDTDDFDDMCLSELYPLLNAIVTALNDPTFVKVNISLDNQIQIMPARTSIVQTVTSVSQVLDTEPLLTTTEATIKPTTNIPSTVKTTIKSKPTVASKVNSKIMTKQNKVKVDVQRKEREQTSDKNNTQESNKSNLATQTKSNGMKSTKNTKGKQKVKRKRMSPRMRRILMLRRKQKQSRMKQAKGKTIKVSESISKDVGFKRNSDSSPTSQNGGSVNSDKSKAQTQSKSKSGKVNNLTGKSNQESMDLKQQAKTTTKVKLAINESNIDEKILTKDMLIKAGKETKASNRAKAKNGSKLNQVTVGKTLRIATKDSAIPVINIKRRNIRKKVKSIKSQKGKKSLDHNKETLKTKKQLDNKETTTVDIQENKAVELSSLSKSNVQRNGKQKSKQRNPGSKKMKWRRRKVSKQRKKVKARRRQNKPETKAVNN